MFRKSKPTEKNPIMEKTNTKIFINIIIAILIMIYFVALHIGYDKINEEIFSRVLQIATMLLLLIAIVLFEIAYKKDSGTIAINGIEILVLSCHSLSIPYITEVSDFDFKWYATISAYIFAIYFIFKAIVIYTLGRKEYLKSLSDIPEIVKKEEPKKKVATKRNKGDIDSDIEDKTLSKTTKTKKRDNESDVEKKKTTISKKGTKTKKNEKDEEKIGKNLKDDKQNPEKIEKVTNEEKPKRGRKKKVEKID